MSVWYGMVFVLNSHKSLNTFVDESDTYSSLKGGQVNSQEAAQQRNVTRKFLVGITDNRKV